MPFLDAIKTVHEGIRSIWKISETVEELLLKLPKSQNLTEFELISSPTRQKEWLAVRVLAYKTAKLFDLSPTNLIKNQWNCPSFEDCSLNISLSHTTGYAVVLAHPTRKLGIDIEGFSPKMQKISPRVFDETELKMASSPDKFAQIWCAKEAVYKFYMKKEINFKKDIQIREENKNLTAFLHKISPSQKLNIYTEKIENQMIAYCISD